MTVEEGRIILGEKSLDMSDDQIRILLRLMESLVEGWLDDYERTIFKGNTINELLTTKGRCKL